MRRFNAVGAAAIIGCGIAVAASAAQLPAFGAESHAQIATPSSAGQQLVCPGSAVTVGASGTGAGALTATGSAARTAGTDAAGRVGVAKLGRGNVAGASGTAPRVVSALPAPTAGVLAAAQSQVVTAGDAVGLVATSCVAAATVSWLSAGATTTGRTSVLLLTNPTSVAATVDVSVWTESGRVAGGGGSGIQVAARSRRVLSIAAIAPNAAGIAVRVQSTGGRIAAALEQRTVRGLESGGIDVTGPTAPPATEQVIPGVRISSPQAVAAAAQGEGYADIAPVVRLLAPGASAVTATVTVTSSAGQVGTVRQRIPAGHVVDVPIAARGEGTVTVRVRASGPVLAAARVSVLTGAAVSGSATTGATASSAGTTGGEDGGTAGTGSVAEQGVDLAWFAAALPLGDHAAVAVAAGPSPQLALANSGSRAVSVRLSGATSLQASVPAHGTTVIGVVTGVVRISGGAALTASVSYAGPDAVAGYPVAPADQQAHAVRVTH